MSVQDQKPPLNRFSRMMQDYLLARARQAYRANRDRVLGLRTRDEALAYIGEVRERIAKAFGPWPQRTPLNLRVTGEFDRSAYRVRKLVFDSRPGVPVTANLYLPNNRPGPRPAVLGLCGHADNGKVYYQHFPQTLAKLGYIVLIFDPMGQGERTQFPDGKGGSLISTAQCVVQHNCIDRQQILVGEWVGNWFVWDCMRAMDVLLAQDNVDAERVGVTGNSGGGTLTAMFTACDPRVRMSAPSCWISSWYHDILNEEPLDAEQNPPGALALGLEMTDLLLPLAPRPLIVLTQEQDFFDQRGSLEARDRLQHVYRLLGAEQNLGYHVGLGGHGFHKDAREAMYKFFGRHAGIETPGEEPPLNIEDDTTLRCTPTGMAVDLEGAQPIPRLTAEHAVRLAGERGRPDRDRLVRDALALLNLPARKGPPDYRILRPWNARDYARPHASQFVLEVDPVFGAQAVVTKLEDEARQARPGRGQGGALLYLPHVSSDRELREDEQLRPLQRANSAFFACDFRGIGESRPDFCRPNSFFGNYGSDFYCATGALMFGESYVGWRVHDVLCTLDWMASLGYDQVHLVAKGWGTIPGALAALLDERVRRVTLIHPLRSYSELTAEPMQKWPLSAMLPGVLTRFDLPDVYRELKHKQLQLVEPWDAMMECE